MTPTNPDSATPRTEDLAYRIIKLQQPNGRPTTSYCWPTPEQNAAAIERDAQADAAEIRLLTSALESDLATARRVITDQTIREINLTAEVDTLRASNAGYAAQVGAYRAFVQECASDELGRISPGLQNKACALLTTPPPALPLDVQEACERLDREAKIHAAAGRGSINTPSDKAAQLAADLRTILNHIQPEKK